MKPKILLLLFTLCVDLSTVSASAQADSSKSQKPAKTEKYGEVHFPISCTPAAQEQFERGVAMLHSYWFTEGGKVFTAIQQQDPGCAMAYWGLAVNLLGNTLSAPPPLKDLQAGAEADREGARDRGENAARARLDRGVERLLPRP